MLPPGTLVSVFFLWVDFKDFPPYAPVSFPLFPRDWPFDSSRLSPPFPLLNFLVLELLLLPDSFFFCAPFFLSLLRSNSSGFFLPIYLSPPARAPCSVLIRVTLLETVNILLFYQWHLFCCHPPSHRVQCTEFPPLFIWSTFGGFI